MAKVEISEFKGHKVIVLPLDEGGVMKFTFGLSKAKAVVKYIDDIKSFVEENTKDDE